MGPSHHVTQHFHHLTLMISYCTSHIPLSSPLDNIQLDMITSYIQNTHTFLHSYVPTYIHIYLPNYIHTDTKTYIHTYLHTYLHAHTHTYIHTGMWLSWFLHLHHLHLACLPYADTWCICFLHFPLSLFSTYEIKPREKEKYQEEQKNKGNNGRTQLDDGVSILGLWEEWENNNGGGQNNNGMRNEREREGYLESDKIGQALGLQDQISSKYRGGAEQEQRQSNSQYRNIYLFWLILLGHPTQCM